MATGRQIAPYRGIGDDDILLESHIAGRHVYSYGAGPRRPDSVIFDRKRSRTWAVCGDT